MPYISKNERETLDPLVDALAKEIYLNKADMTDGAVNYAITRLLYTLYAKKKNYDKLNRAIGVLECAKIEFYRMQVAPYEVQKITEHGPIEIDGMD